MVLLEVKGLTKFFGGIQAVNDISFQLEEGQILGMIGPNGTGKTTVFNMISGHLSTDAGSVIFRGENITNWPAYKICKKGIARTFQIVKPFRRLTVYENVMVGAVYGRQHDNKVDLKRRVEEILEFLGLADKADLPAGNLTGAALKRLEVAKALATDPYLLLLDEVLAGLNSAEVAEALKIIKEIRRRGTSIIMTEHILKAIIEVADEIMVLAGGKKIAQGTASEIMDNKQVIEIYLGEAYA
jgi:branched-chain amino acid transport system ATP-binding protein